tara:strand:+ start:1623 stop:1805 length:183 start_codon:yes stop_codon:yes gene_type:complete
MNSVEEIHNIFEIEEKDRSIQISIDSLSRGIDNYHIDVRLSKKFSSTPSCLKNYAAITWT